MDSLWLLVPSTSCSYPGLPVPLHVCLRDVGCGCSLRPCVLLANWLVAHVHSRHLPLWSLFVRGQAVQRTHTETDSYIYMPPQHMQCHKQRPPFLLSDSVYRDSSAPPHLRVAPSFPPGFLSVWQALRFGQRCRPNIKPHSCRVHKFSPPVHGLHGYSASLHVMLPCFGVPQSEELAVFFSQPC